MSNVILKNMNLYQTYQGKLAILLKHYSSEDATSFDPSYSTFWIGSSKVKEEIKEEPFILKINEKKIYFYPPNIKQINNFSIKENWIDPKTKNEYQLSSDDQQNLINFFAKSINNQDLTKKTFF